MPEQQVFSGIDKMILKSLLEPKGNISSSHLAEKLGVPRSTIQRRREHLEKSCLSLSYSLELANLPCRRVDLLIYTSRGATMDIAKALLKFDEVVYVGRSIGEHTIDLRAEIIIQDNAHLLAVLELVHAMENVRDVVWSEIVDVIGRKRSIPSGVIDSF